MGEFFDWLFNSEETNTIFGYALIFGIGGFLYIMNWAIFFNDLIPKKKWISAVPPLGGLLIAIGFLIAGLGWWALLGLTDPGLWLLVHAIIKGDFAGGNKQQNTENKEDKNDNGN